MNTNIRNFALWVVILLLLGALYQLFQGPNQSAGEREIAYSAFISELNAGRIDSVTFKEGEINGSYKNGSPFVTFAPDDPNLIERLEERGVSITVEPEPKRSPILSAIVSWFPMLLLIAVWIFFMRQMQGGGSKAMGFGKSKAKLLTEANGRVIFDDVAGVEEAKEDLQEIVDFLREPQKFQRLGGRIPRGLLLVGPPGTGKTLIARAVAGEANVPFFTISGSDFVEMFVGVGASRVRDMFEQAKNNSPCIIFIDEIDAVGRHRGAGMGGGNDEREQTLNQLLVEMDGFEANENVIIIAATNRPDVLDKALLRPGRFDRQVMVPNPDVSGREKILKVHVRKVPLAPDVNLKVLARATPGFSGADLMNLVNEAALLAARRSKRLVTMGEFEDAKDKVMMGAERRTLVMGDEEKKLTAYHEAGHALVTLHMEASDPIHKATIIPRGRALGMVMRLPEKDQVSLTRAKCKADLAVAMGGRVAEEIIFGHEKVTSGASADIQMATKLATAMVTQWGMSEKLGMIDYGPDEQTAQFAGRNGDISPATLVMIEEEIRDNVDLGYNEATRILTDHNDQLHIIANGLLEYETLSGTEIKDLLDGKPPLRDDDQETPSGRGSSIPKTGHKKPKDGSPDVESLEPQLP